MATSKQFKASIVLGGSVAGSLKTAFGTVGSGIKRIGAEVTALNTKQKMLGRNIQKYGRMGENIDGLRKSYARVTVQLDRQRAALAHLTRQQSRYNTLASIGGKLRSAGYGMGVAGAVMGGGVMSVIGDAKRYQTEKSRVRALGLGEQVTKEAVAFAADMKTFGTGTVANLTMVRDALSVFGDLHHAKMAAPIMAKMKFANEALYGKEAGGENESKFLDMLKVIELRGGTKSEADFNKQANLIQQVISATGGRVGPEEWRHLIKTGGLAAKGTRDDAFYFQMEPLVQEMGGDRVGTGMSAAYSNLYQGRTSKRAAMNLEKLGLIGDHSKVTNDKVGQVSHLNPGALLGSDVFRQSQYEWLKTILLPALAKKGLTSKDQVLDAIGSIFTNRKGADLMGAMYLQAFQIDKSERMNRGAYNIDQGAAEGKNTTAGQELDAEARLEKAKVRMGTAIMPMYTKALQLAASAFERLNVFVEKHPKISKILLVGVAGLAAAFVTLAPVLITVGFAMTPLAKGFGLVSTAVKFLGRTILTSPIFWIGAAIAGVVYEVYKHWSGIKAFFSRLWGDLRKIFGGELKFLKGLFTGNFGLMVDGVKQAFSGMGDFIKDIFHGISNGIKTVVLDALDGLGLIDKAKADYEERQLAKAPKATKDAAAALIKKDGIDPNASWLDYFFGGGKPSPATSASIPPMATAGRGASAAPVQQSNVYHITQQPGESGETLARRVSELQKYQAGVQHRGMMLDGVGG